MPRRTYMVYGFTTEPKRLWMSKAGTYSPLSTQYITGSKLLMLYVAMFSCEILVIGKVHGSGLNAETIKACAEITECMRICPAIEIESLKPEAEKSIEQILGRYESILVEGFIRGLSYVATVIDVEKRSELSSIYI